MGLAIGMFIPCFCWEYVDLIAFHIGENCIDLSCQLWIFFFQAFYVVVSEFDRYRCTFVDSGVFAVELI